MDVSSDIQNAYKAVSDLFNVQFECPCAVVDDARLRSFYPIKGLRDFGVQLPQMVFDDVENIVIVNSEMDDPAPRTFAFCHELGHAYLQSINPQITEEYIFSLINEPGTKEQGYALLAFSEGIADRVAILACKQDPFVRDIALQREACLLDFIPGWKREVAHIEAMAKVYKCDPTDITSILLKYYEVMPERVGFDKYHLGYHFTKTLIRERIPAVVLSPPSTFRELLYPEGFPEK